MRSEKLVLGELDFGIQRVLLLLESIESILAFLCQRCHDQSFDGKVYIDCRSLAIMPKEEDQFPAVVSYGRVTIPQNIRKRHGIVDGDEVVMLVVKKVEK